MTNRNQKVIPHDTVYNGIPFNGREKYQRVGVGGEIYLVPFRQLLQVERGSRKTPSTTYKITEVTEEGFETEKVRDKQTQRIIAATWRETILILEGMDRAISTAA